MTAPVRHGREFFTTVTVDAALQLLADAASHAGRAVPLAAALGRTPASPVRAASRRCPGSPGPPSTASRCRPPTPTAPPRGCRLPRRRRLGGDGPAGRGRRAGRCGVAVPTGGVLPDGADAVVMVEHTQETMPGIGRGGAAGRTRRRHRAGRRGRGGRRRDRPRRPAAARARTSACSPPPGSPRSTVHRRPGSASSRPATRWCRRTTAELLPGQVRDATALGPGRAGARGRRRAGPARHRRRRRGSAGAGAARRPSPVRRGGGLGRLVGRRPGRDRRRGRAARRAGDPVPRPRAAPGKPTLLAQCGGVPVVGLPGNPLSALVVFRLVGVPLVRRVGGCTGSPPEPGPAGPAGSAGGLAGRPARRRPGDGSDRRGGSRWPSRCSVRPRCCRCSPPPTATSSSRGGHRPGCRRRRRRHPVPVTRDQPVRPRRARCRGPRGLARTPARRPGCPQPGRRPVTCPVAAAAGPGHRRAGLGDCARHRTTTPPRWTASRCGPPTPSAPARARRCCCPPTPSTVVDTGDPMPAGRDAVVMREHVHRTGSGPTPGRAAGRGRAVPARPVDR